MFIRILLFVIPILSSFRGLPGKKSKKNPGRNGDNQSGGK
uniref:Uncharacterized protein n=1 Tax=Salmonella enterica subsp. enterica serovar Heidelberg TaxID=611 RepID=H9TJE2_SALET|nr:hypothetical protein pSH163_120_152 [Salmonella enterica subsp. enterica serovar Heidelberg]AFG21462.1 hypothetical protein pSH696_117_141 [Salmonella enterica subsp. enterica serovar Heidelberg]